MVFGIYVMGTVGIRCLQFLTSSHIKMRYWMIARHCIIVYRPSDAPSIKELDFTKKQLEITATMITQLLLPILPVCASFLASMVLLHKSKGQAKGLRASGANASQAAVTVSIVTLVYICFNIPVVVHFALVLG